MGQDNFTRVDTYRDWIEGRTGPIPGGGQGPEGIAPPDQPADPEDPDPIAQPEPDPNPIAQPDPQPGPIGDPGCGDLDFIGRCAGDVVEYCKEGQVRRVDCAGRGLSCDWHSRDVGWWCVQRDGCGDLDYFGRCDGDTARWCDDAGRVQSRECARWGMSCGWIDDQTGNYCTAGPRGQRPDPAQDGPGGPGAGDGSVGDMGEADDPARPDSDGDGIPDAQDLCSATPPGSIVWRHGEWIGCAGGQFRD